MRPSQRPNNVAYYQRNRAMEIARVRVRQAGTVEMLRDLRRVPCADCGGKFEPHQMDFDHRDPSTKSFNVMTGRAMLMSTRRLMDEVAKCDIVCANCHRVKTRLQHVARLAATPDRAGSRYIENARRRWRGQAALLNELRNVPCADCGARLEPCAMDFDHRDPATKEYRVTAMIGRAGTARILAEAAKCDIVCANCHRARTYDRRERQILERE